MEMLYKTGDWIEQTYNTFKDSNLVSETRLLQVDIAEYDVIRCTNGSEFRTINNTSIKLWQPSVNQLCLFWNNGHKIPRLGLLNSIINQNGKTLYLVDVDRAIGDDCFEFCAPYLGNLPKNFS